MKVSGKGKGNGNGNAIPSSTKDIFARHQLRFTKQRREVYDALNSSRSHPTAEELFRIVQPRLDRVSLATVYNTLEVLCRVGLVRKMPTTNGCCRFDADMSTHLHLRYRDTAEIIDVPDEIQGSDDILPHLPARMLREIEERFGVRIDGVSIQLLVSRRAKATDEGDGS